MGQWQNHDSVTGEGGGGSIGLNKSMASKKERKNFVDVEV